MTHAPATNFLGNFVVKLSTQKETRLGPEVSGP